MNEVTYRWIKEKGVIQYSGRDIILVDPGDGILQPFYKSSGRNSGRAGTWFPFDGIVFIGFLWFDKGRFCNQPDKYDRLNRYGTELNLKISQWLAEQDIPAGEIIEKENWRDVNKWLGIDKDEI